MEHKLFYQSFHIVEIVYCNFYNVENSGAFNNVETVTIPIVNYLEYFFQISAIEPTYLRGLQQILPQSAKFLCANARSARTIGRVIITFFQKIYWH